MVNPSPAEKCHYFQMEQLLIDCDFDPSKPTQDLELSSELLKRMKSTSKGIQMLVEHVATYSSCEQYQDWMASRLSSEEGEIRPPPAKRQKTASAKTDTVKNDNSEQPESAAPKSEMDVEPAGQISVIEASAQDGVDKLRLIRQVELSELLQKCISSCRQAYMRVSDEPAGHSSVRMANYLLELLHSEKPHLAFVALNAMALAPNKTQDLTTFLDFSCARDRGILNDLKDIDELASRLDGVDKLQLFPARTVTENKKQEETNVQAEDEEELEDRQAEDPKTEANTKRIGFRDLLLKAQAYGKALGPAVTSARFIDFVRATVLGCRDENTRASCSFCCEEADIMTPPFPDVCFLSRCGHTACSSCFKDGVTACQKCHAEHMPRDIFWDREFKVNPSDNRQYPPHGQLIQDVASHIRHQIPEDDQVLCFTDSYTVAARLAQGLREMNIDCTDLAALKNSSWMALKRFTSKPKPTKGAKETAKATKVMILNVKDETASGA